MTGASKPAAPWQPTGASLAAGAILIGVVASTVGFCAGCWASGRRVFRKRRRDDLCECGVVIPAECSPEERARHKTSTRHKKNCQQLARLSEVVCCEEVTEYRAAALGLVTKDDYVLEVGCHVGGTTKVLATVAGGLIGLDQQPDLIAEARVRLPDIQFELGDAFDAPRILALANSIRPKRFTKVFIDISGSRDLATVVRLMDIYENTLRPEILVVKSQALKRMLLRSRLWIHHPVQLGEATLPYRRKGISVFDSEAPLA